MLPSSFTPPFPPSTDPRANNIIFNPEDKWEIITPGEYLGDQLAEGSSYEYGSDISVKANWLKKVLTNIWCPNGGATAQTDLTPYVHVTNGTQPGPSPYDLYAFFSDGDSASFSVSGANNRIVQVSGRYYRFIGWSAIEPPVFQTSINPFYWCTQDLTHQHQNLTFNSVCLKNEYAAFVNGADVNIIVTTNDPGDMGLNWNNNDKINYKLTWSDNSNHIQPFNSIPQTQGNPLYTAPTAHVGDYFTLETYSSGGENLHYLNTYELQGWYLGTFSGFDPDDFAAIQSSPYFFTGDISERINAIMTPITVTAIYMPASNQYTITYYSGLPD